MPTATSLPQTTKLRTTQGSLCSGLTGLLELASNVFYFKKSDQMKIIPIKKHHWACRTASAHLTQRPTPKFRLSYVWLVAATISSLFNGIKAAGQIGLRALSSHMTITRHFDVLIVYYNPEEERNLTPSRISNTTEPSYYMAY